MNGRKNVSFYRGILMKHIFETPIIDSLPGQLAESQSQKR